jgi:hypothetical protein
VSLGAYFQGATITRCNETVPQTIGRGILASLSMKRTTRELVRAVIGGEIDRVGEIRAAGWIA